MLGRNEDFLEVANIVTDLLGSGENVIRKFPAFLHPLIAFFSTRPLRYQIQRCTKIMTPEIESRKATLARTATEPEHKCKAPNDCLVQSAVANQPLIETQPQILATRLAMVNFAANHSSTITATQAILEICSTDPARKYAELLRAESLRALIDGDGKWTKEAVGRLTCIDSAIRESQRMSSFDMHVGGRIITAAEGLTLPNGMVLPRGSEVETPSHSIHFDEGIYLKPYQYDPLRFSRSPSIHDPPSDHPSCEGDLGDPSKVRPLSIVNASPDFLAFGHGRHACPGRHFAASVLKLLLASLVLRYEVKPFEFRPSNVELGETLLPHTKIQVLVRRRSDLDGVR